MLRLEHEKWYEVDDLQDYDIAECLFCDGEEKLAKYKEMYDAFQPLKHLQLEFIEENKSLDEDVYITRFGNGEEIVVNYSMKPFKYREKYVPPRDYLLFK